MQNLARLHASFCQGSLLTRSDKLRFLRSYLQWGLRGKSGWMPEVKLSESPANDWEPAVAVGSDGSAYVAWDTYDRGNYDIEFRSVFEPVPGIVQ